jgi:hypothetical protein
VAAHGVRTYPRINAGEADLFLWFGRAEFPNLTGPMTRSPAGDGDHARGMLARYSVRVKQPFRAVEARLLDPAHEWAHGLEGSTGQDLLVKVGAHVSGVPLYRTVRLRIGPSAVRVAADRILVAVSWETSDGPALFPRLDGHLEVEACGPGETRLALNASYAPPLGAVGEALDRMLLHRLGEATLEDFVRRLAAALESEVDSVAI